MAIHLHPRYFDQLTMAERLERLDPLESILGGAQPIAMHLIPSSASLEDNQVKAFKSQTPPEGEMLGWISAENHLLTIGLLDDTIICDLDDQSLARLCDQRFWIRFDNPMMLRSYVSGQVMTSDGHVTFKIRLTEKEPPKLRRTVIWIDSEGDQHLGKLVDAETVEYQCYGGQDEILKSINEFPYWMDIPFNAINRDLHIGDDLEED